ncbi:MAG: co-chaperone GroES [Omnitrophica bacterium]|nr:co-chaperone GroES [Candidatus Omnitrophota bacterium]
MSLKATRDIVIVKIVYAEKMQGLYVPDQAKQYSGKMWGEVRAVGPEYPDKSLRIGDKLLFVRHEGVPVDHEGERLWALKEIYCLGKEV